MEPKSKTWEAAPGQGGQKPRAAWDAARISLSATDRTTPPHNRARVHHAVGSAQAVQQRLRRRTICPSMGLTLHLSAGLSPSKDKSFVGAIVAERLRRTLLRDGPEHDCVAASSGPLRSRKSSPRPMRRAASVLLDPAPPPKSCS